MRHQTIVRAGVYTFAAGAAIVLGGVAEPAAASPPVLVPSVATDCDVPGGQPGGEHAPGGHDDHDMTGETTPPMDGSGGHEGHDMTGGGTPPAEDHGEHESHGTSTTPAAVPSDGTRQLVLGGFAGVNGAALVGAAFLRRRTAAKRGRHLAARAGARPARSGMSGEER